VLEHVIIEIVNVPVGEAPEEIRKAWVGIQVEAVLLPSAPGAVGVISRQSAPRRDTPSYAVRFGDAVDALIAAGKTTAEEYWRGMIRDYEARLLFHAEECRELLPM